MFGYVLPYSSTVLVRDAMMFRSVYCGICLSIKNRYGNLARFTTNYDITVLALLVMELTKPKVEFFSHRCICEMRKHVSVRDCEFLQAVSDVNILLTYYKLVDDEIDSGKKVIARRLMKKAYQKARSYLPEADRIISEGYNRLREMEKNNVASLDRTADCFASLLEQLLVSLVDGSADEASLATVRKLCYNIGKFVYLADALDDLDEDAKGKRFNPILAVFPDYERGRRLEYIDRHHAELKFAFTSTVNRAIECVNQTRFTHVGELLRNIMYEGLREKTNELFSAKKKLPPPILSVPKQKVKEYNKQLKAKRRDK